MLRQILILEETKGQPDDRTGGLGVRTAPAFKPSMTVRRFTVKHPRQIQKKRRPKCAASNAARVVGQFLAVTGPPESGDIGLAFLPLR